jgi:hypothetical protein
VDSRQHVIFIIRRGYSGTKMTRFDLWIMPEWYVPK